MPDVFLPAFLMGYSDSSFTNPHEVALPDEPPECTGSFTHMGAKYWGFETSRHLATETDVENQRFHYHDDTFHWFRLGLKQPGVVRKVTVSTKWFTGNQIPEVSIDLVRNGQSMEVVSRAALDPDSEHEFTIEATEADECLVRCYLEGGIARVNLFGEQLNGGKRQNLLETASISHVSNEHYGKPRDAVTGNREVDYMLGWESARTGFGEQALFTLASPAIIDELVVDTYLHRLNPPLSCHLFGATGDDDAGPLMAIAPQWILTFENGHIVRPDDFQAYMQSKSFRNEPEGAGSFTISLENRHADTWLPILPFAPLEPDTYHRFTDLGVDQPVTLLLYMHYPNGGVHGLKAFGKHL